MITVVAVIKALEGKENEMEAAFIDMVNKVKVEEGTISYILHRSAIDETTFLFYEQYTDEEAFDLHSSSPLMAEMFEKIGPLLDGEPSIDMYDILAKK